MKKPELLAPAGNWPSLLAALENGADSVYFGLKGISMRHWANNFDILEIKKVMDCLHEKNKRGYLALNTVVMNPELKKVERILIEAKKSNVDAVILWDMAVYQMAKDLGLRVHISTQASVANTKAIEFFAKLGAKRVILARECTLKDLEFITMFIKEQGIDCEIESFIHGAMCVSISGRCFLSYASFGQSANKGQCIQPCRREYWIKDTEDTEYILGKDYVLSPKDLCTIDFFEKVMEAGIDSFKIEGRMRSPDYLTVVTSVYRQAIDSYMEGSWTESLKKELKKRLETVYNRGFSSGFYFGQPVDAKSIGNEHLFEKVYLGEVTRFFKKIDVAEIKVQNESLKSGDTILFIGKSTPALRMDAEQIQVEGAFINEVEKGMIIGLKVPFRVRPRDKVFLWREKCKSM